MYRDILTGASRCSVAIPCQGILTYTPGGYILRPWILWRKRAGLRSAADHVELGLTGMTCAACAARIEKVLNRVPGVHGHRQLRHRDRGGRLRSRRSRVPTQLIAAVDARRLRRVGARAIRRPSAKRDRARKAAEFAQLRREFIVSALLTAPLLLQMVPMLGGRVVTRDADSSALAAARARHAGPVLDRPALLRRCVARAARRRRQHGRAGRARHHDGVRVQRRGHRARPARPARLLRGGRGRHHARAPRQAARGAREGRHVRRARGPAQLQPKIAHLVRDGSVVDVPLADVAAGDRFVVRAGESIPGRRRRARRHVGGRREHADRRDRTRSPRRRARASTPAR